MWLVGMPGKLLRLEPLLVVCAKMFLSTLRSIFGCHTIPITRLRKPLGMKAAGRQIKRSIEDHEYHFPHLSSTEFRVAYMVLQLFSPDHNHVQ